MMFPQELDIGAECLPGDAVEKTKHVLETPVRRMVDIPGDVRSNHVGLMLLLGHPGFRNGH